MNDVVATAADSVPKAEMNVAAVTEHDIARRAYELFLARGRGHGHDIEDWLQAEQELRQRT
jgi:hypothetical protein